MTKQIASLTLLMVLLSTVYGNSARAQSVPDETSCCNASNSTRNRVEDQANERLRANILKLVADTKEGKVTPTVRPQGQIQKKNHLSKGTKIAIAIGVVAAVVAIIFVAKSDKGPTGPLPVF